MLKSGDDPDVALKTRWNSLGLDDGDNAGALLDLSSLEVGTDVVKLAIVPACAIRLLELKDGDLVLDREGLHLPAEAVADFSSNTDKGI